MIDEPPYLFLMTPAQRRQWAANARRRNRPDLARAHEQLARAIEKIAERKAEHNADRVSSCVTSSALRARFEILLRKEKQLSRRDAAESTTRLLRRDAGRLGSVCREKPRSLRRDFPQR
jgi:hypothetical protein